MMETYFKEIGPIKYEGEASRTPLAYRWYNPDRIVLGKTMKEHLRFSVAAWHTLCNDGSDPFGSAVRTPSWLSGIDHTSLARQKVDALFEFMTRTGIQFYCFHDTDIVGDGSVFEIEKRLTSIIPHIKEQQNATGKKLLWGTANLFSNSRYMNGAFTNPDFKVVANAAAQVRNAISATIELGGANYVFWGGREGYMTLHNTDMKRELAHMGKILAACRDYGRREGFSGIFLVEPKPMEPMKHQYDYDAATVIGFLREYGLQNDFKLNIEVNHATLAGHTFQHELQVAADAGLLGSIDANKGDYQNGWDTDEFPTNIYEVTEAMLVVLRAGGLKEGGINFDARIRRNSADIEDLFISHISGMDTFSRALIIAEQILNDGTIERFLSERYASFDSGTGLDFEKGGMTLDDLYRYAAESGDIIPASGRQERLEQLINMFI
jgi:xylose isomerase